MNPLVRGALTMLVATSLIALSTLFAKMLSTGPEALSPFQVSWGRYLFGFMFLNIFVVIKRPSFSKPQWPIHAVRIVCGWAGVTCMFGATAFIPLGDVSAIAFTNPIFAMLLAIPILGERIGKLRWMTAGLALIGALLLVRPGTETFQPAALIALLAAGLFAMELVVIKILTGRESVFQLIYIANGVAMVLSSLVVVWVWQSPTSTQWLLMAATGLSMVSAQVFFTKAVKLGDASFIAPFSYATLLFAALYDFAIFSVIPVPLSILGGLIVIASGIVLAWRESVAQKKNSSLV